MALSYCRTPSIFIIPKGMKLALGPGTARCRHSSQLGHCRSIWLHLDSLLLSDRDPSGEIALTSFLPLITPVRCTARMMAKTEEHKFK
jgi:hypothetical protein